MARPQIITINCATCVQNDNVNKAVVSKISIIMKLTQISFIHKNNLNFESIIGKNRPTVMAEACKGSTLSILPVMGH